MDTNAAASQVSVGSLSAIFDSSKTGVQEPIVQCVQIKPLPPQPNSAERYRAVFSDISNYVQTMLATRTCFTAPSSVSSPKSGHSILICEFAVFKKRTTSSPTVLSAEAALILIVLDLDVLDELGECEKIGEPKPLEIKPEEEEEKARPTTISTNGFYGSKPQQLQQANLQGQYQQPREPSSSSGHANIYPIEALSPYSHRWTIKARCTSKSAIKNWSNRNGDGKLFSVNLLDDSGEIRATGFNDQCDALYPLFEEGGVYYITSPCRVQIAKKQFTNLNNDYELTFEKDTVVEKAEEQSDVPQVRFNFTTIGDLEHVEKDTTIDVVGLLTDVGDIAPIFSKTTKKSYDKRELSLVDHTGYKVRLTIWGATATGFDAQPESVVAFKGVKVSDFGGRSLSLLSSGTMTVDPDIEEAHKLKGWYDAQGRTDTFTSHASLGGMSSGGRGDSYKTISQVGEEQLGMSETPDFFSLKATVVYIKQENVTYAACLSPDCNKKVTEVDPGQWRCERCDKNHPKPEYRYIISINVSDHTGQTWLSCFDDAGRVLMGITADQLMELRENDEKAATKIFQEANCKTWNFRCKAKMDTFQDQQRVRYQISSANPINYSSESSRLADLIKSYSIN
ncbi:Replication factor A protein 1 [Arachnomyces sp. PD_36]|nr:Replication factor A protein 1 [Arachnomyces sp. PD_36]